MDRHRIGDTRDGVISGPAGSLYWADVSHCLPRNHVSWHVPTFRMVFDMFRDDGCDLDGAHPFHAGSHRSQVLSVRRRIKSRSKKNPVNQPSSVRGLLMLPKLVVLTRREKTLPDYRFCDARLSSQTVHHREAACGKVAGQNEHDLGMVSSSPNKSADPALRRQPQSCVLQMERSRGMDRISTTSSLIGRVLIVPTKLSGRGRT